MNSVPTTRTRTGTVATVLRSEILSGQYRPGERLPSERDLCQRFGVSRSSVREALKQLQQLGIASIKPGGARVAPVSACTLDVLGPLLDLHEVPDAKLADEVLQMIGVLVREAATAAIEKATAEQLEDAERIIDAILARKGDPAAQFDAVRRLGEFFVTVADNLVLRLTLNGLRTSFVERMAPRNPMTHVDKAELAPVVERIRQAVAARNSTDLGVAMLELNRIFRLGLRASLQRDPLGVKETSA